MKKFFIEIVHTIFKRVAPYSLDQGILTEGEGCSVQLTSELR
jgi:hypothetical protein